jgi:hypothetical protein
VNDQELTRLRARAEHLLDLTISLRERYSILLPLAYDQDLANRVGGGPPFHGYTILKNVLLASCVQDLVKLTIDADPRTPSVSGLMSTLERPDVRARLLQEYSVVPPFTFTNDAPAADVIAAYRAQEGERLVERFNEAWSELIARWASVKDDAPLAGFKTWRDKLIAHSELHHTDGKYHLHDLSNDNLKWADLGGLLDELQAIVQCIQAVTRGASFAWDLLDEQTKLVSTAFWGLVGQAASTTAV